MERPLVHGAPLPLSKVVPGEGIELVPRAKLLGWAGVA